MVGVTSYGTTIGVQLVSSRLFAAPYLATHAVNWLLMLCMQCIVLANSALVHVYCLQYGPEGHL